MLYESIKKLVQYGIDTGLTPECERIYTTNLLFWMYSMKTTGKMSPVIDRCFVLKDILADLLKEAVTRGIIEDSIGYRDLFDTRLMNCLLPRPAQVQNDFWRHYQGISGIRHSVLLQVQSGQRLHPPVPDQKGPQMECRHRLRNTGYYHQSVQTGKDPKAIAAARNASVSAYPKCQLCMENEGYAGRLDQARPERITASFRSRSMTASGDSSILLMSTTMSTVSCSTENILR